MLKNSLLLASLVISFLTSAQMGFKKVTLITKQGDSIECKANLKLKAPVQDIIYKINSLDKFIDYRDIAKILNRKKEYIIATVEFDNTSNRYQNLHTKGDLGYSRYFSLVERTIYLELLVSGKKPLYKSHLDGLYRFFFKDSSGAIVPLLYKRYFKVQKSNYLGPDFAMENNFYFKQLSEMLPCKDKSGNQLWPEYKELNLMAYFKKYNAGDCQ